MASNKYKKSITVVSFLAILGGFFFLSGSLTGMAVIGMEESTSTSVGSILIVVGVLGAFIGLKKDKLL